MMANERTEGIIKAFPQIKNVNAFHAGELFRLKKPLVILLDNMIAKGQ
ncbi:MAG: hypothetical protein CM1200mP30_34320 [Pseudomonadota bacterium]|nr:MAG: hypothetical protein CM1200mP30_34320 [Pseudomonadota bacterium]